MERAYAELIRRIHDRYRVVVISCELAPSLRPFVDWRRVRAPLRPFPLRFVLFWALGSLKLSRVQPDLVQPLGAIVANHADIAAVHFCHSGFYAATGHLAPPDLPALRKINTSLTRLLSLAAERWCYRPSRLSAFVAVSRGVVTDLEARFPGIPVTLVPNGVDLERYRPDLATRREVRAAEQVEGDEVIVLFVGGDWDRKGVPIILEALRETARAQLWVLGQGDEARASEIARSFGVVDRVRFFGARMDAERFYAAADIFCLPSLYEAFPLVALEAAASGLPIVGTPVHGVSELIGDGEAGVLVERSALAVGEALRRLVENPALRAELGAAARSRVADQTWDAAADTMVRLYEDLLAGNKRTRAA
jgi:UDP-glucose:(heptosyl)LPS alpha-1,3-glucosyltransferase